MKWTQGVNSWIVVMFLRKVKLAVFKVTKAIEDVAITWKMEDEEEVEMYVEGKRTTAEKPKQVYGRVVQGRLIVKRENITLPKIL